MRCNAVHTVPTGVRTALRIYASWISFARHVEEVKLLHERACRPSNAARDDRGRRVVDCILNKFSL